MAHFQSEGNVPLFSDLLNRIDNGTEINSLTDLIIVIGHPSGPEDLLLCRAISLLKTVAGVISMESSRRGEFLADIESTINYRVNGWFCSNLEFIGPCCSSHAINPTYLIIGGSRAYGTPFVTKIATYFLRK